MGRRAARGEGAEGRRAETSTGAASANLRAHLVNADGSSWSDVGFELEANGTLMKRRDNRGDVERERGRARRNDCHHHSYHSVRIP